MSTTPTWKPADNANDHVNIIERPTNEEIEVALSTINDIATFVAMRGLWMTPVPELVKVTKWLEGLTKE